MQLDHDIPAALVGMLAQKALAAHSASPARRYWLQDTQPTVGSSFADQTATMDRKSLSKSQRLSGASGTPEGPELKTTAQEAGAAGGKLGVTCEQVQWADQELEAA